MAESSIFQKEEELLILGNRFLEEHARYAVTEPSAEEQTEGPDKLSVFYRAFEQLFSQYKKLFQQTVRMIRLSDRTQLRLDTVNKSLRESQLQLERRNQFIRSIFSRYMSDEVVESILETPEGLQMGGEKRLVTVVMSDLRGFTAISETLPAETVVDIINQYLERMTAIIFKHKGTINSFMGDGIMVLFGAPVGREDDAQRAVACALEMQLAMPEINALNQQQGYPELGMGIGIHTGMVVAGNIGSQQRSQYTVMGKAVNLAARIESFSVGGQVLISERTRQACQVPLRIDNTLEVMPKGIEHSVTLHEVGGIGGAYSIYLGDVTPVSYRDVAGPLPVQFAMLTGKKTEDVLYIGEFFSLSARGARLRTAVPVTPFTNLNITLKLDEEAISGIFAKVVRGGGESGELEIAFTFVPPRAQTLFQTILDGDPEAVAVVQSEEAVEGECVAIELTAATEQSGAEARISFRRVATKKIVVPVQMADGTTLRTTVGDFSLDGMLLRTGRQRRPAQGAQGVLTIDCQGVGHPFPFEVMHTYQQGIGVRITEQQDLYAMTLLEGAFGDLFASIPPPV